MATKIALLLISCSLACSPTMWGKPQQDPRGSANEERAKQLWERAIVAKGGRDHLYQARSLLTSYGTKHPTVVLTVFPDKRWYWADNRPSPLGLSMEMCNMEFDLGYLILGSNPSPRRFEDGCRVAVMENQLRFLMETRWVRPSPVEVRDEQFNGKSVDAVFATVDGWKISYLLDKQTHLPVAFRSHGRVDPGGTESDSPIVIQLADYMDIAGIQVPTSIRYLPSTAFIKHAVQVNVDYDERLFQRPPSLEDGPDAWRKLPVSHGKRH